MNNFKKTGGFTLVELIVVIAILGILAAVAIPAYSGYITKSQDAADLTALGAVKTACMGALAKTGTVEEIAVTADEGVITEIKAYIANDADDTDDTMYTYDATNGATWANADFALYMNNTMIELTGPTFAAGAEWAGAEWTAPVAEQN